MLAGCIALGAMGIWVIGLDDVPFWTRAFAAFLAISSAPMAALGVGQLARPPRLVLRKDGIEQTGFWRRDLVPWTDIREIVVWRQASPGMTLTHVGYWLTEPALRKRGRTWTRILNFGRYDQWLLSGQGSRPGQVAGVLKEYHRKALSRAETGQLERPPA